MTKTVWAAIVMATAMTAIACGGGNKPPMVPDQPGDPTITGDAGDVPATTAPASVTPANPH